MVNVFEFSVSFARQPYFKMRLACDYGPGHSLGLAPLPGQPCPLRIYCMHARIAHIAHAYGDCIANC